MVGKVVAITRRAHALALLEENIDIKRIQERMGLSERTIYRIRHNAIQRGYDGENNFLFQDEYFEDSPWEGRPRKMDEENEGKS